MSELPARLSPGQRLSAHWLNRLLDYLRARELRPGPGVHLSRTPSGTTISAAPGNAVADGRHVFPVVISGRVGDEYTGTEYDPATGTGTRPVRLFLTEICQEEPVPSGALVLAHEILVRTIDDSSED